MLGVLTSNNANVFYELGIAHATQPISRQVLIADDKYEPRFDLKDLIFYRYEKDLTKSIVPLADRIINAMDLYQFENDKIFKKAIMALGPYEFEVLMDRGGQTNFAVHTSTEGRADYEAFIKERHKDDEGYWKGSFERQVFAITNLCRLGLLGLNVNPQLEGGNLLIGFSHHWTDLGNCVLKSMKIINEKQLLERREGMPRFFSASAFNQ